MQSSSSQRIRIPSEMHFQLCRFSTWSSGLLPVFFSVAGQLQFVFEEVLRSPSVRNRMTELEGVEDVKAFKHWDRRLRSNRDVTASRPRSTTEASPDIWGAS